MMNKQKQMEQLLKAFHAVLKHQNPTGDVLVGTLLQLLGVVVSGMPDQKVAMETIINTFKQMGTPSDTTNAPDVLN